VPEYIAMSTCLDKVRDDKLHKFLLKKLSREIATGQSVLHLSSKQMQIEERIAAVNQYFRLESLDDLPSLGFSNNRKIFAYVVADMDMSDLDDFDNFLDRVAPLIVRPGLLCIVATNLSTFKNQVALLFGNELENYQRPSRAVTYGYLRKHLLEKGYKVKNRYWQYDNKLLIMAETPINS
jgi:hypothetical protein